MPLWGVGTNDEAKPKWLSEDQKKNVFADARGYVQRNADGTEEVLVAIGGLADSLAAPTVSSVAFADADVVQGTNLVLNVYYNEPVEVVGNPTIAVTGGTTSLVYAANGDPTRGWLTFEMDTTAQSGTVTLAAAASIALAGGTITDETDGTTAAELALNNDELTATISV